MKLRIAHFRKQQGMTQEDLAAAIQKGRAVVAHYETGRATPSAEALIAICRVLDVSLTDLVADDPDTTEQADVASVQY